MPESPRIKPSLSPTRTLWHRKGAIVSYSLLSLLFTQLAEKAEALSRLDEVKDETHLKAGSTFETVGRFAGCTGVLVSPDKLLTSAHCLDKNMDGIVDAGVLERDIFFGDSLEDEIEYTSKAKAIDLHPLFVENSVAYDLAVVTLKSPIYVRGYPTVSSKNPLNKEAWFAGYGRAGTGSGRIERADFKKRAGQNMIDSMGTGRERSVLQCDFDSRRTTRYNGIGSPYPLELESSILQGDSGAPLIISQEGQDYVVGILLGGYNNFDFARPLGKYGSYSLWAWLGDTKTFDFLSANGIYALRKSGFAPFSNSVPLEEGWRYSEGLGKFRPFNDGWTLLSIGWVYIADSAEGYAGFWAWHQDLGWFYSSEQLFPNLYSIEEKGWLFFDQSSENYYNFKTMSWQ